MDKTLYLFAVLLLAGSFALPLEEKPEVPSQPKEESVKIVESVPVVYEKESEPIQLTSTIVNAEDVPAPPQQSEELIQTPEGVPVAPNPEATSDLESANTFWGGYGGYGGWGGYRRPYYGGWGRGFGGWGGGYGGYGGWGRRSYGGWGGGWGGRGFGGWGGYYW